jgi:prepilin-type N-terminal cleavage/methylation domain-containing protein
MNKKGFTVIEGMIAVVIIAFFAAIAVPSYHREKFTRIELTEKGYEKSNQGGLWFDPDTKIVVEVDLREVSDPLGTINCSIKDFKNMNRMAQLNFVTYFNKTNAVNTTSNPDIVIVDGVKYRKIGE